MVAGRAAGQAHGDWSVYLGRGEHSRVDRIPQGETVSATTARSVLGLFIYTGGGYVAILFMPQSGVSTTFVLKVAYRSHLERVPALPAARGPRRGYIAYWGTYTVDMAAGVVVHHVKSDFSASATPAPISAAIPS